MKKVVKSAIAVGTQSVNKMISNSKNKIALTLGDPSGIGPEVIVKALDKISKKTKNLPIIIGDTKTIINTLWIHGLYTKNHHNNIGNQDKRW